MGFLALTNGSILSGTSNASASIGTLLIRDSVIHGIYDTLKLAEEAAGSPVECVDIAGMTAMPGLIDCHVHLFFSGSTDSATQRNFDAAMAMERAKDHLRAGVTTVRDLGAPEPAVLELRDRVADRSIPAPRILASGLVVTTHRGHGWFVGTEVASGEEAIAAITEAAGRGVDCVKIMASGGVSTEYSDLFAVQFSESDISQAVHAAHDLGLHVAAHASNAEAVRICALAGVDSIEHAVMIDGAAMEALAQSEAVLVPTLVATHLPPDFSTDVRVPTFIREKAKITMPVHRRSIRRAIAAGVGIVGGTDAGSTLTGHGLVAMEADLLVSCGLSNDQAVAAFTRHAAGLLGLADRLGTLERGKVGDVVVIGGNPIEDIAYLADVRLVVKEGEIVHRAA